MDDVRVAAGLNVLDLGTELPVSAYVELLATLDQAYRVLSSWHDGRAEPPVNPLMLTDEDLADAAAREAFAAELEADGVLSALGPPAEPPSGEGPHPSLQVQQLDGGWPVYLELTGDPPLLLVAWLLGSLDGEYTVTEEYGIEGEAGTDVHKRVSFTTSAPVAAVSDALRDDSE